jgi:hypothetical protein
MTNFNDFFKRTVSYMAVLAALLSPAPAYAGGENQGKKPDAEQTEPDNGSSLEEKAKEKKNQAMILLSNGRRIPAEYLDKAEKMPDISQLNKGLPSGGRPYCGPAAASNLLACLDRTGFDRLIDGEADEASQLDLVRLLAGSSYMKTGSNGTTPTDFMSGLEKYIASKGYKAKISFKGVEHHGRYNCGKKPDLAWLLEGVNGNSNIILNIGYYTYNQKKGRYERTSGHFANLVGYRIERDKYIFVIHDPGTNAEHEYSRVAPIQGGAMLANWNGNRSGAGCLVLKDKIYAEGKSITVIDGAVRVDASHK